MKWRRALMTAACVMACHGVAQAQGTTTVPSAHDATAPPSAGLRDLTGNLSFTAAAGQFGAQELYSLQLAFHPNRYLGLEATLAHNPASGVHAALHHFGALVPVGSLWRIRPFVTAGLAGSNGEARRRGSRMGPRL